MKSADVEKTLGKIADKKKAKFLAGYFKTGRSAADVAGALPASTDVFLGVIVPKQREIAKKFFNLSLSEIQKLLKSKIHECRLTALLILVLQFEKGNEKTRKKIFDFYIKNTKYINNWDLIDLSSHKIVGAHLLNKPRDILYKFDESKNIWERRIAVVSTYHFICKNDFVDAFRISEKLLADKHDLIHKSVGWMLREVGKRDKKILLKFLDKHRKNMPRTMLRYAIEKFPKSERKKYLTH
jgi:3-methyladenine DNA glycosylase AlkD